MIRPIGNSFTQTTHIPAVVFDYRDAIAPCYVAADLIISRAGAGMLFEILFFEKPSIIIPLEAKTTSHQLDNAYAMTRTISNIIYRYTTKSTYSSKCSVSSFG